MFDMQATMFQPVGGMYSIAAAFEKRLADILRFHAPVEQIRKTPNGVRVVYRDLGTGMTETIEADYCVCALPLSILKTLDTDLSPDLKQAIGAVSYDSAYKIAWESRRFWEQEYSIYGGISFPKQTVSVVWYPSAGIFSNTGVIIAGYGVENRNEFGKLDKVRKLEASRQAVEHLHPGHSHELTKPLYVSWGHIPYNLGSWASHRSDTAIYTRLIQPDGAIYLAGDHVSHLVAWQEGAALSAHRAVMQIANAQPVRRPNVA
jgi:monoamine oxidase